MKNIVKEALFSLAPAILAASARAAGSTVFGICLYGACPVMSGAVCFYAAKKGMDPYLSLPTPLFVMFAVWSVVWHTLPYPGGILLAFLAEIPGAAAGAEYRRRKKK